MTTSVRDPDAVRGVSSVPFQSGPGSLTLVAGDLRLIGWSAVETTGAASAQFDLVDGTGTGGALVGVEALAASQAATRSLGTRGVQVHSQLTLVINSGTVRGVIYYTDN